MNRLFFTALLILISQHSYAQMPVPLIDNSSNGGKNAVKNIQAALECESPLDIKDNEIRKLLTQKDDLNWTYTPPKDFTVMGLSVKTAEFFIDPSGENGQSYDAHILSDIKSVKKALKLHHKRKLIQNAEFSLAEQKPMPVTRCLVKGAYDESDYQEPSDIPK
ncbi:MAG: hypothetical protein ABL859_11115 [Methylotenera sp.]